MSDGIAVLGAVGGCGTTALVVALAVSAPEGPLRVLALDGHGGGPHRVWGLAPERTVDDLQAVRDEVGVSHVEHILHRQAGGREVLVGPMDGAGVAWWSGDAADRLARAITPAFPWLADLGRGDHAIARAVIAHASGSIIVAPCTVSGAEAVRRLHDAVAGQSLVVGLTERPGAEAISFRAFRRLVGGVTVVEVPWPGGRGRRARRADALVGMRLREALRADG